MKRLVLILLVILALLFGCAHGRSGYDYRIKYDENGDDIEMRSYRNGKLAEDECGSAIIGRTFDEHGRLIEARHFGADGEPKENCHGVSILRLTWNEERLIGSKML